MKNKLLLIFVIVFCNSVFFHSYGSEEFNFDVTEIQILENGNKFIGNKRGTITSDGGIIIKADQFQYDNFELILMHLKISKKQERSFQFLKF